MNLNKYTFQIDHVGEPGTVQFTIMASSQEIATVFATRLNPNAKLVRVDSDTETGGRSAVFPTGIF